MPDREALKPESARVFFALWPDEEVRRRLDRIAGQVHALRGGRRTRAETLHLTLVFLGDVARERLPELRECAGGVDGDGFEITFDRLDCWHRNRIAHLAATRLPAQLIHLVGRLEGGLRQLGFRFDARPYKAHITLVRHADCGKENPATEPLLWTAQDFVLVESCLRPEGASYTELGRYPLR
jgi:2'-5' RNA ligase